MVSDVNESTLPAGNPGSFRRPTLPSSPAEITNTMTHYYRGELARMTDWRDRIDRTTNWAITVCAALLSVSLSTPSSHHGVVIFAMLLVTLLLLIEARRYRFFDVYRARIRQMERYYFAQVLSPEAELHPDWASAIAASLRVPRFLISYREALQRRLRRNYCWMYFILLLAWALKISTPKLQADGTPAIQVQSWAHFADNATLGPVPGWLVLLAVTLFYAAILYGSLHREPDEGELAYGEVHV
jgi:uncharacterized membrane protein